MTTHPITSLNGAEESLPKLSEHYGVSRTTISRVVSDKNRRNL